jgi:Zn-finger nucleic acid-binding protein
MMTPRFKGKPNFDFSLPCPLCGYKIQPNDLMRLASHIVKCPKCGGVFLSLNIDTSAGRVDRYIEDVAAKFFLQRRLSRVDLVQQIAKRPRLIIA